MKITITKSFEKDYLRLPQKIQKKTDQKIKFLEKDLRHPSIRAKKMQGKIDIWEGRIDGFYRFTFEMEKNEIIILRAGPHDKALR